MVTIGYRLAVLSAVSGCLGSEMVDDRFTQEDWQLIQSFRIDEPELRPTCPSGLPSWCDPAVALGRRLFATKRLAGQITVDDRAHGGLGMPGDVAMVACVDCHDPRHYFVDTRSVPNTQSLGTGWTKRNAISLVNIGFIDALATQRPVNYGWDGKYNSPDLSGVLQLPVQSGAALNTTRDHVTSVVATELEADYWNAFGRGDVTYANIQLAFAAYEYRLVSIDSPFDHYLADCNRGDCSALTDQQKHGLQLFIGKASCSECHNGPLLSDGDFHNTGVQQGSDHAPAIDMGRGPLTTPADTGKFRTPPLRNVAMTAPYMHAGQFGRLDEVVNFYNQLWPTDFAGARDPRLAPLGLDDDEVAALVAFLESLTGSPPDPSGGVP